MLPSFLPFAPQRPDTGNGLRARTVRRLHSRIFPYIIPFP